MATARVVITASNKMSPALLQAKKSMMEFNQTVSKVGNTLKSAFGITTAIVAVKKLGDTFASAFEDFNEADRKYKQLQLTLGNGDAYESVVNSIKKLSKQTLSAKSDVESMVAELAALGKSPEEIDKVSTAAVALANVTGKDLSSSMTSLLSSYSGTVTQLGKLIPEVKTFTKEELESGAAVDLIIEKFGKLSEEMALDDASQHVVNIKNNFGDLKQVLGDLVTYTIKPLLRDLDEWSEQAVTDFNNWVQQVKVVFGNLPEVAGRAWEAIKGGLSNLFSVEGITTVFTTILKLANASIKAVGTNLANLGDLAFKVMEEALSAIGNYAMYWVTHIADQFGINISELVNSIGTWLTESPIGKFVDSLLTGTINQLRLVLATVKNIPAIVKIVVNSIGKLVGDFFSAIPTAIKEIALGIMDYFPGVFLNLKNNFLQTIQDAINTLGEKLQGSWIGKLFGIGEGMATLDLGIDRSAERAYTSGASEHFANAGAAFGAVGEDLKGTLKEIDDLMAPTFEKFISDNSKTIGQTMATWTSKSSDEYYKAAKKSFTNIGDFLEDWGANFLGDLGTEWQETSSILSGMFDETFGGEFDSFLEWFRPFMEQKLAEGKTSTTGIGGGNTTDPEEEEATTFLQSFATSVGTKLDGVFGSSAKQWTAGMNSAISGLLSNLGEAGDLINNLATNMATMGPVVGAIVTALEYVFEGFGEVLSGPLNEFINYGLEPLKEIGRVIGSLLVPLIENLMPLVEQSASFLIGVFDSIGVVLMPIIQVINSILTPVLNVITNVLKALEPIFKVFAKVFVAVTGTIQYVIQTLQHWIATVMNWFASLSLMGWHPFGGLRMSDPGSPGSYSSYISDKWSSVDAAFSSSNTTAATSTGTTVSSAGYQGATSITINIYQQAPVVGDAGMRQFASMIKDEFDNLNYYGVTA